MSTQIEKRKTSPPQISIIKYDNRLNNLQFSGLSSLEMNILFVTLGLLMNQGVTKVSFTFDDIAYLADIKRNKPGYLTEVLKQTKQKIFNLSLNYLDKDKQYDASVHMFRAMEIDGAAKTVTLLMEEQVEWLINGIKSSFTAFELRELIGLKKKVAKNLFVRLKQWKTVGTLTLTMTQARDLFGIPDSCPDKNIMSKYLKPAVAEILSAEKSFSDLTLSSVKAGKNHELVGFEFGWTPELIKIPKSDNCDGAEVTEKRKKTTAIKYKLGDEKLTVLEYEKLVDKYDSKLVDEVINRIIVRNYQGKLNFTNVDEWCKEKSTEIEKIGVVSYYPNDDKLDKAFTAYLEMRSKSHSPLTEESIEMTMAELEKYSFGDNDVAIEILNRSITNGWKGIYPLHNDNEPAREKLVNRWFT